MRNFITSLFCILVFAGCSGKKPVPKGILKPEKMQNVMWDLFQAQAWAQQTAMKDSLVTVAGETKLLSMKVFKLHNISDSDFSKSYQWYLQHPEIFSVLLDSLHNQKSRANNPELKRPILEE